MLFLFLNAHSCLFILRPCMVQNTSIVNICWTMSTLKWMMYDILTSCSVKGFYFHLFSKISCNNVKNAMKKTNPSLYE